MVAAQHSDVIIVGAGLSGLACAIHLSNAGRSVTVIESSDGVGGRVRSDQVDGFILDRGFQVLLTAYPEAKAMLDYDALDLRSFKPGALVQLEDKRVRVSDPLREPTSLLASVRAPIGSLADKLRIGKLRLGGARGTLEQMWGRSETSTAERIRALGFSDQVVQRFFRPLFTGIQLDASLATSSRMFDFVFRMLATGDNAIPARGIQAIPDQLAARLPSDCLQLNTRVASVAPSSVTLTDGAVLHAGAVVVATDGPQAAKLLNGRISEPSSNSVSCLYFAADRAPVDEPILVLNGVGLDTSRRGGGMINNVCVPSIVSPHYAPAGRHLVSASIVGARPEGMERKAWQHQLETEGRVQLRSWFGAQVDGWTPLPTVEIPHAQPAQPTLEPFERPTRLTEGLYVCGDHRDQASIHGALVSGRRAADAVTAQLAS
jgi:phytoene dehydrogenase-like protein